MGIINWIFGKHPPRPIDPHRSMSAGVVPSWHAELLEQRLKAAGIDVIVSEDNASYLTTGSTETMCNLFVMEPDLAQARRIVEEFTNDPAATFTLRAATDADGAFLRTMLHATLFVPDGADPPSSTVIDEPPLSRYVDNFGHRNDDVGWIAESTDGVPLGAAWVRLFSAAEPGYGFVDATTPELSIAVAEGHRDIGIGTALLIAVLDSVERVALSVDRRNRAVALYHRFGFRTIATNGDTITMATDR